jgi:hypothetical protein
LTNKEHGIYAGTIYDHTVFFPTEGRSHSGGRIYALVGGQWRMQYATPTGDGPLHVVLPYQPTGAAHVYIYAGGSALNGHPSHLLRALYK